MRILLFYRQPCVFQVELFINSLAAAFCAGAEAHRVVYAEVAGEYAVEFAFYQLFAYAREVVDKQPALEVVALMLHDAGKEAADFLAVLVEVLVEPREADMLDTRHILADAGKAEAALRNATPCRRREPRQRG